jgi:hypothetical protein
MTRRYPRRLNVLACQPWKVKHLMCDNRRIKYVGFRANPVSAVIEIPVDVEERQQQLRHHDDVGSRDNLLSPVKNQLLRSSSPPPPRLIAGAPTALPVPVDGNKSNEEGDESTTTTATTSASPTIRKPQSSKTSRLVQCVVSPTRRRQMVWSFAAQGPLPKATALALARDPAITARSQE